MNPILSRPAGSEDLQALCSGSFSSRVATEVVAVLLDAERTARVLYMKREFTYEL